MRLLAIDPGNEESALLVYDTVTGQPVDWVKAPNMGALPWIDSWRRDPLCNVLSIEMVASYGMAVGASVFETCVWAGRFIERWSGPGGWALERVYRRDVKLHLCNSARAKDANVRQALIDRYGGKEKAIGKKASPGPLYGLSGDCWSALAVAVTAAEREQG
jgi:hypothetical protein